VAATVPGYESEFLRAFSLPLQAVIQANLLLNESCRSPRYECLEADNARALRMVECFRNLMAHAQKPDFVFRRNGRVHLNQRGRQFSRLLAAEVCASELVMLDTPRSEVV
jgi:hypothetical protein